MKRYAAIALVTVAVILLAAVRWLDEEVFEYWLENVIRQFVKALEKPQAYPPGVWLVPYEGQPIRVAGRKEGEG